MLLLRPIEALFKEIAEDPRRKLDWKKVQGISGQERLPSGVCTYWS